MTADLDQSAGAEDGFDSAQYLVSWVQSEFASLVERIQSFAKTNTADVIEKFDGKTNRTIAVIKFHPVPAEIRGHTNNIVKNLRDALDQATSAASHLVRGSFKRNCHFPFGSSPQDFDDAITKGPCKDIPASLYPILRAYSPYPTSDEWVGGDDYLRALGYIAGPHKHRFTLSPAVSYDEVSMKSMRVQAGAGVNFFPKGQTASRNNELVLMSVGQGGYVNFDLKIVQFVAFSDTRLKGTGVESYLKSVTETVGRIVRDLQTQATALQG